MPEKLKLINLGNVLKITGRYQEATKEYEKALHITPDSAETHNNWGVALANKGDLDGVIAHYKRALDLNPKHAKPHNNWGAALVDKADTAGGIDLASNR